MQKKFTSFFAVVSAAGICLFSLIGCAQPLRNNNLTGTPGVGTTGQGYAGQNMAQTIPQPGRTPALDNSYGINRLGTPGAGTGTGMGMGAGTGTVRNMTSTDAQRAARIKSVLQTEGRTTGVTVAVNGNTALVGYDTGNAGNNANNYVKDWVVSRVRQLDPGITNVAVSQTPDIAEGIRRLSNDMNRPANDIKNDFDRLLQRIAPLGK